MIPYLSLQRVTNEHLIEIQQAVNKVIESGWYLQGQGYKRLKNNMPNTLGRNIV